MPKKLLTIFIYAFLLNLVWENLHSHLYANYQGRAITEPILLRATLFDALFVTILSLFFIKFNYLNDRKWYALIFGFMAAALIEIFALKTGRWTYNQFMPVIPVLNTGLTPTLQLGLISYLILKKQLR